MKQPLRALVSAVASLAAAVSIATPAHAAPSIQNGDCWQGGTPFLCRTTFSPGQSTSLDIYAIDHFSTDNPGWSSPWHYAAVSWTNAAGPQVLRSTRVSNDSWVYYEGQAGGSDLSGAYGVTYNCDASNYCTNLATAMNISYSSIKLNRVSLGGQSATLVQETIAHETGHALGLAHSPFSNQLMYGAVANPPVVQPTVYDTGHNPPCVDDPAGSSESSAQADTGGIRCIYSWSK